MPLAAREAVSGCASNGPKGGALTAGDGGVAAALASGVLDLAHDGFEAADGDFVGVLDEEADLLVEVDDFVVAVFPPVGQAVQIGGAATLVSGDVGIETKGRLTGL